MRADYTVVITRPDGDSFAERVRQAGFSALIMPLFTVMPTASVSSELENLTAYDWLLFTSRNGVRFFRERYTGMLPEKLRCAVIGSRTADALREHIGRSPDYQGEGHSSEQFAPAFFAHTGKGARILLLTAREHRGVIVGESLMHGVTVETAALYERQPLEVSNQVLEDLYARPPQQLLWPFFSPSAFHECIVRGGRLQELLKEGRLFAIGTATAQAIREQGFKIDREALVPSEASMVEMLLEATR